MALDNTTKKLNYIAILTLILLALYVGAGAYMMFVGRATFTEFSAAIGPLAGMLVSWLVKDSPTTTDSGTV